MEQVVVGCVQLRMRLPQSIEEIDENAQRFARMAQTKRVRLIVFPQFAGLMTAVPVIGGARAGLLKTADRARGQNTSFWERTRARIAGGAAGILRADFGRALEQALLEQPEALRQSYTDVFGRLARQLAVTVVAGSTYLVDSDGAVRHITMVFGPDGEVLGRQAAVSLPAGEHQAVQPGNQWQVIPTPAGRLGILLGQDMLYPETGRLLAYAGAEVLIGQGASTFPVEYHRQRQGLLARVEENQLYGAMSFLVGHNPFTPADELPYVGKSLLAAPLSMTPRFNNVLVEMGTDSTEGLITAEWSYPELRDLWARDRTPVRATMPVDVAGPMLSAIYARRLSIDQATRIGELMDGPAALPEPEAPRAADAAPIEVDELPAEDADDGEADAQEIAFEPDDDWLADEDLVDGEAGLVMNRPDDETPRWGAASDEDLPDDVVDVPDRDVATGEGDAGSAEQPVRRWPWSRGG